MMTSLAFWLALYKSHFHWAALSKSPGRWRLTVPVCSRLTTDDMRCVRCCCSSSLWGKCTLCKMLVISSTYEIHVLVCSFYSDVNRNDPVVFAAAAPTRIINLYATFISRWACICQWMPFCLFSSSGTEQQFIDVIRKYPEHESTSWCCFCHGWSELLSFYKHLSISAGLLASPHSAPGNLDSKNSESRVNGGNGSSRENSTVDFSKVTSAQFCCFGSTGF